MKKLIYILASAALLGACEQKTEVTAPGSAAATPDPANTGEKRKTRLTTAATPAVSTEAKVDSAAPAVTTETKTETKTETETTTLPASTPNP